MVGESLLEHLWSEAAIAARVRFQVFFFLSFKFQVNTRLSIVCTLKELQKLDNKHLYLNTVERSYRHILVQYELKLTQNKTGQTFIMVGCAINRFIKI